MQHTVFVFVTYGSFGDVNPLLAIARELVAGAAVRFVTNEVYRAHVEAAGVPFHAAGTPEEQAACTETAVSSGRTFAGLMTQFRQHVGKNIPRLAEYLRAWHARGESLLVITHGTLNPAFPICEALGIPVVRAYYAPSHLPLNREDYVLEQTFYGCSEWKARLIRHPRQAFKVRMKGPPHARHEYNQFRRAIGIAPSYPPYRRVLRSLVGKRSLQLNEVGRLLLTPRWFAEPLGSDVGDVRCVGFPFFESDAVAHSTTEQRIDAFITRFGAPVVFTPGTGVADMEEFCRPIETVCHRLQAPGILVARHGQATYARLERVLNHPIIHVEHADFSRLLPRSRLLVHTGGIGTIAQAVRAGVLQIIHPMYNDQPRNALRVLMNGLGGVLQGGAFTSSGIAALHDELAASELHQSCLAHYAHQVRAEHGARVAAQCLMQIAENSAQLAVAAEPPRVSPQMSTVGTP